MRPLSDFDVYSLQRGAAAGVERGEARAPLEMSRAYAPRDEAIADQILDSVKAGRMPCTGRWPERDVEKFQAWKHAGFPP